MVGSDINYCPRHLFSESDRSRCRTGVAQSSIRNLCLYMLYINQTHYDTILKCSLVSHAELEKIAKI